MKETKPAEDATAVRSLAESGVTGSGGALPHLDTIQRSFGQHDVSSVRAHVGGRASDAAQAMGADAYAIGSDVAFARSPDLHTAAHEAAHTIQQRGGVQLKDGVGQVGDSYERHADIVADAVVAGRSAEALLTPFAGPASGGGVQQKAVQREAPDTAKTPGVNVQVGDIAKNNKQATGADGKTASKAEHVVAGSDPFAHPQWPVFLARVTDLFSRLAPPAEGVEVVARRYWSQVHALASSQQALLNSDDVMQKDDQGNVKKGVLDFTTPGFQKMMTDFEGVLTWGRKMVESQFAQAKSFGFWSRPEGRALAEQMTDLTLETSGVGALFDGMSIAGGWDMNLWGSLSRTFGQGVAEQIGKKGKRVHVFMGGDTPKGNIFGAIESKALQMGAEKVGKTLEDVATFHAVGAIAKDNRKPDLSLKGGEFSGTLYSGKDIEKAREVGLKYWQSLQARAPGSSSPTAPKAPSNPGLTPPAPAPSSAPSNAPSSAPPKAPSSAPADAAPSSAPSSAP